MRVPHLGPHAARADPNLPGRLQEEAGIFGAGEEGSAGRPSRRRHACQALLPPWYEPAPLCTPLPVQADPQGPRCNFNTPNNLHQDLMTIKITGLVREGGERRGFACTVHRLWFETTE